MARPASDIEARITQAARARFLLQGVDGASLRSIAQDARTSIGMVYYYFKTKDELFLAVVEGAYGGLLADLGIALTNDVPPEQRLERVYQRLARIDEREFDVLRLILREALISSARLSKLARRFEQGHIPLVVATVMDGIEAQRFDASFPLPVLVACAFALGILPQLAHRLVTLAELPIAAALPDREAIALAAARVLLHGIAGPALIRTAPLKP
jgi:AcrR family transcriptional regulator